jgi:hypothetical protein
VRKICRPSDAHTCAHHRLRNRNAPPPHRFLRDEQPACLRPLTRQAQHVLSGELIARTNRCGTWSTDFVGGPCGLRSFVRVVCPKEEVLEREVVWLIFVLFGMSLGFLTPGCAMVSIGHASPRGGFLGAWQDGHTYLPPSERRMEIMGTDRHFLFQDLDLGPRRLLCLEVELSRPLGFDWRCRPSWKGLGGDGRKRRKYVGMYLGRCRERHPRT